MQAGECESVVLIPSKAVVLRKVLSAEEVSQVETLRKQCMWKVVDADDEELTAAQQQINGKFSATYLAHQLEPSGETKLLSSLSPEQRALHSQIFKNIISRGLANRDVSLVLPKREKLYHERGVAATTGFIESPGVKAASKARYLELSRLTEMQRGQKAGQLMHAESFNPDQVVILMAISDTDGDGSSLSAEIITDETMQFSTEDLIFSSEHGWTLSDEVWSAFLSKQRALPQANTEGTSVRLYPGDALFIKPYVWHRGLGNDKVHRFDVGYVNKLFSSFTVFTDQQQERLTDLIRNEARDQQIFPLWVMLEAHLRSDFESGSKGNVNAMIKSWCHSDVRENIMSYINPWIKEAKREHQDDADAMKQIDEYVQLARDTRSTKTVPKVGAQIEEVTSAVYFIFFFLILIIFNINFNSLFVRGVRTDQGCWGGRGG